jgi:hypothetical protein
VHHAHLSVTTTTAPSSARFGPGVWSSASWDNFCGRHAIPNLSDAAAHRDPHSHAGTDEYADQYADAHTDEHTHERADEYADRDANTVRQNGRVE